MGTRNLTMVRSDKKIRVAQYGQWDGYPTGQGQEIADFLKKADLKKFKKILKTVKEYKHKEIIKAYSDEGATGQWITSDVAKKVYAKHPSLDRDHGAGILTLIYEGKVNRVQLSEDFKNDRLFCEYWYEVNLDDDTVTMNGKTYTFKQWTSKNFMKKLEK